MKRCGQLAEQYLRRRQAELGERIDPERYPTELQRVKASDRAAPGLRGRSQRHRRRAGRDLTVAGHDGVRPAGTVVRPATTARQLADRRPPRRLLTRSGERQIVAEGNTNGRCPYRHGRRDGRRRHRPRERRTGIHHFLLPASGWGSAVEAKEAVALAPEAAVALKKWRSDDHEQADQEATRRAGRVGAPRRVRCGSSRCGGCRSPNRRPGATSRSGAVNTREHAHAVTREQIEATLNDPNGAYQRLRRVMDAWAALWFWPLTDTVGVTPPTIDQWIDACQALLGREPRGTEEEPAA